MIELTGARSRILEILQANPDSDSFFLKTKPSKLLFAEILSKTNARKILVSKGILKTIPKKVRDALAKTGVSLVEETLPRGRKRKVSPGKIREAIGLVLMGKSLAEAAKWAGVSTTWLCIRLREFKRKNSKRGRYLLNPSRE